LTASAEPSGSLEVALGHASRLLTSAPSLAAEQANEILKAIPHQPTATLILGIARRLAADPAGAVAVLDPLARSQPKWAVAHCELGLALGAAGRGEEALIALRRAVQLKPDLSEAWLALADHLTATGDTAAADAAYARHIKSSTKDPRMLAAATALCENRIPQAESMLRAHLKQRPTDVAALRMLAEVAARLQRFADAEVLLSRCLELAPGFDAARHNYATVLFRQNKIAEAQLEVDRLLAKAAHNHGYRNLQAAILGHIGQVEKSIELFEGILAEYPGQPRVWLNLGHALKAAGRQQAGIDAYRQCIALAPHLGEAYWSLANMKTTRFEAADLEAMRAQLERTDLAIEDRFHFDFAMGKALEDAGAYAESFECYSRGNELRAAGIQYSAEQVSGRLRRSKSVLTHEFFAERAGFGAPDADPIFIVGLPRAGSTLLEQILASHSAVEGTMELPDVISLARTLAAQSTEDEESRYPAMLAELSAEDARALGEQYLSKTRIQRRTSARFFIDKMPNNFAHLGLIQLMLPNAKIIDARRHPLGCCFSAFKQHFARGQHFSYSLDDLGRYYRDYVELMAHYDAVLPGRIHRVIYEQLVENTEAEIRRLLQYCGLPFEDGCLRFYEKERTVRTASSEQVRQPIFRDAVEHWRHYEPWLGPLKSALGPVLDVYPGVPEF
jgi:tetratricopeptide (TPR) repeat protein